MEKSVDIFTTQYYNNCRILLLMIGQWPYQNKVVAITLRIIVCSLIVIFVDGQICRIIKSWDDTQILIEASSLALTSVSLMIRFVTGFMNMKTMKKMMDRIKYDLQCAVLNNEVHIFESFAKETYNLFMKYSLLVTSSMFVYVTLQIASQVLNRLSSSNVTRLVPVRVELFVDEDKYFLHIMIFTNAFIVMVLVISLAMDSVFTMTSNHACAMLAVTGHRLEHAFRINLGERDKNEKAKEILARIVDYHMETLKFVSYLNYFFSGCFILLLVTIVITFSIMLLHVCMTIKASENLEVILVPAINISGGVVMVLYNCTMAQRMIDTSLDVFHQSVNC
ncbi:uncharacterized protein LOC143174328 isoform X2 [Nomia melanderi]|uniref:uncharacterized protein LOC143174328 isoform X2 n=1 Tax=Nomia melanderi TaxID=2448451 RepID=UPI003FCE8967